MVDEDGQDVGEILVRRLVDLQLEQEQVGRRERRARPRHAVAQVDLVAQLRLFEETSTSRPLRSSCRSRRRLESRALNSRSSA